MKHRSQCEVGVPCYRLAKHPMHKAPSCIMDGRVSNSLRPMLIRLKKTGEEYYTNVQELVRF